MSEIANVSNVEDEHRFLRLSPYAIINNSPVLSKVVDSKRELLCEMMNTGVYTGALERCSDMESVHKLMASIVSNASKSKTTTKGVIDRFRRMLTIHFLHFPPDDISMKHSKKYELLDFSYTVPSRFHCNFDEEMAEDIEQLLVLLQDFVLVLKAAQKIKKLLDGGYATKHVTKCKRKILNDCEDSLRKHPSMKEKGFHTLMSRWGVELNVTPASLFKKVSPLSKKVTVLPHIKRLELLCAELEAVILEKREMS